MPISIKNSETETLARKLSELTGETLTEAVAPPSPKDTSVYAALATAAFTDDINAIVAHYCSLPVISDMSDDEILGYDEMGIPTR